MRMSFRNPNLMDYLSDLLIGKGNLEDLKTEFKVKKADPWDGKDAPPLEEYEDL